MGKHHRSLSIAMGRKNTSFLLHFPFATSVESESRILFRANFVAIPLPRKAVIQYRFSMECSPLCWFSQRFRGGDYFIQWNPIQVQYRNFTTFLMVVSPTGNEMETIINLATKNGRCEKSCSIFTPFMNLVRTKFRI